MGEYPLMPETVLLQRQQKTHQEAKVIYTYKKLNSIMRDVKKKSDSGRMKLEEAAIGTAAAYAVDLMDISREIGKPLDLTVHTSNHLLECIMRAHISNMATGHNIEESREILTKMLASYEMFTLINDFGCVENTENRKLIKITVLSSVMMPKPKMLIETMPDSEGKVYRFDIFEMAREAMKDIRLGAVGKGDGMFFAGSLQPFHQRINTEMVSILGKIVKDQSGKK